MLRSTPARTLGAALTSLALLPAVAAAQTPATTTTTTTTTPPVTAPATGQFTITAEKVGPGRAVLAGTRFRIRGVVQPYVAGQTATVRVYRGDKKLFVKNLALLPSKTG